MDSLPKKTGAQDKDSFALTPPRNRSEFDRQSLLPCWYLIELTYADRAIKWQEGGIAVIQNWYLTRANTDSEAYRRVMEQAATAIPVAADF